MRGWHYLTPEWRELNPCAGGRRLLFKGGSSSSSNSSESSAEDNRIANDSGLIVTGGSALEQDNSITNQADISDDSTRSSYNTATENTTVTTSSTSTTTTDSHDVTNITDGESVAAAMDAARANYSALLTGTGRGFEALLGVADKLFDRGAGALEKQAASVADAYREATAEKSGTLDNKTIVMLGVAGAVALVMVARKGK